MFRLMHKVWALLLSFLDGVTAPDATGAWEIEEGTPPSNMVSRCFLTVASNWELSTGCSELFHLITLKVTYFEKQRQKPFGIMVFKDTVLKCHWIELGFFREFGYWSARLSLQNVDINQAIFDTFCHFSLKWTPCKNLQRKSFSGSKPESSSSTLTLRLFQEE